MGKTYVLDRVATDLARGFTHPAIQRLSSLVAAYPTDLDLRRRLAAAYRRIGNRVQAGRWDYLTIGADASDTTAFERAFPSALARLRAIRWPYRAAAAPTSYARSRLAKLVAAAEAEVPAGRVGAAAESEPVPARTGAAAALGRGEVLARLRRVASGRFGLALAVAATGVMAALVALGAATVLEWIIQ